MWRKAMVYLGLQDDDEYDLEHYDDVVDDEPVVTRERAAEQPAVRPIQPAEAVTPRPAVIRKVPATTPTSREPHVVEPSGFNDAQEVGDRLKASQPVIVNLQGVDKELQRRLIDFSSGLAYALGGSMTRVADQVFLISPSNVEVSAEEKERLSARGLYRA